MQELNSDNPSRLLLNAIESEVDPLMAKQDEFFLGALDDAGEVRFKLCSRLDKYD